MQGFRLFFRQDSNWRYINRETHADVRRLYNREAIGGFGRTDRAAKGLRLNKKKGGSKMNRLFYFNKGKI
jgi:hypothetical protein